MKRKLTITFLIIALAAVLPAQTLRFLDSYTPDDGQKVLGICYPTRYALESVVALRNEGFLPTDKLLVVGLYHEAEDSDYAAARQWAEGQGFDWLVYHEVRGELNKDNLWQKNPCTAEFEAIFNKIDGLILFGGADIPPYVYGRETLLLTGISTPARHFFEASFIHHLLGGSQNPATVALLEKRPDFPLLGLCLGEQTINVGTGGTMIQDIWFQVYEESTVEGAIRLGQAQWHNNPWAKLHPKQGLLRYNMHAVKLLPEGKLTQRFGFSTDDQPMVVSSHHQMVDDPGKDIRIIATSLDGKVPEAIEHARFKNVLGLQFHPEFDSLYDADMKARIKPEDQPFSLRSILTDNQPSWAFHKAIWQWFTQSL